MSPPSVSDPTCRLLLQVGQGSATAFEELYCYMANPVYSLILGVLRERGLALEVSQEVFLQCWRKAESFDPELGTARAWLLTLAHHKAIDALRRERRRGSDRLPVAEAGEDVADRVLARLDHQEVLRALGDLPETQKEAITLAYYAGFTHVEIAEKTGISLGTIKTRIRDGMQRLRSRLGL